MMIVDTCDLDAEQHAREEQERGRRSGVRLRRPRSHRRELCAPLGVARLLARRGSLFRAVSRRRGASITIANSYDRAFSGQISGGDCYGVCAFSPRERWATFLVYRTQPAAAPDGTCQLGRGTYYEDVQL